LGRIRDRPPALDARAHRPALVVDQAVEERELIVGHGVMMAGGGDSQTEPPPAAVWESL